MIQGYTHVGHIVRDINEGIHFYTGVLGFKLGQSGIAQIPGGRAVMVAAGNGFIELIQPTDSDHRVGKFLKDHGEGLFHLSLRVDDIAAEVRTLRAKGLNVEDPREISTLPSRPKIAFIDARASFGAFIELAEEMNTPPAQRVVSGSPQDGARG